jgi:hypothetical protein
MCLPPFSLSSGGGSSLNKSSILKIVIAASVANLIIIIKQIYLE